MRCWIFLAVLVASTCLSGNNDRAAVFLISSLGVLDGLLNLGLLFLEFSHALLQLFLRAGGRVVECDTAMVTGTYGTSFRWLDGYHW